MLDFSQLLIGSAWAQTAAATPPVSEGSMLIRFLPVFLIFAVFYFLLIRPQQKKIDTQVTMLKALKKGDKIITAGGVIGTITKLEGEDYLTVEIADGVLVRIIRSTVNGLHDETKPAKPADKKN